MGEKRRAAEKYGMFHPASRAEWRAWLAENATTAPGIWLVSFKKATGEPRIEEGDAIEEALCFGWIDSLPRSLDERRSMLLMTPRKAKSNWSAINKERAARMIAQGRMTALGQEKIEDAKANGPWDALNEVDALTIPDDLAAAFALVPPAADRFAAFPRSAKRGILEWIVNAKTPATRARRVEETARLAAENIRANQWRQPKG
jgi:uncharacterized protein YdeI (YjbR/CyaY-like superfamily)